MGLGSFVSGVGKFAGDIFGGLTGADKIPGKQRKSGKLNATYIKDEAVEKARRDTYQFNQDYDQVKAAIGSSGIIADTGTSALFLEKMTEAFDLEMAWDKKAANSRAKIAKLGGDIAATTTESSTNAAGVGALIQIGGFFVGK